VLGSDLLGFILLKCYLSFTPKLSRIIYTHILKTIHHMHLSESVPRNAIVYKISEDGNALQCSS